MFDIQNFSLEDLVACGAEVRAVAGRGTFEATAAALSELFATRLVDAEAKPACALVRCYATVRYARLPAELQQFAAKRVGAQPSSETRCLTLLGTHGVEASWCSRARSLSHQAIPLLNTQVIAGFPMIRQLLVEFGLSPEDVVSADPSLVLRQRETGFNVFHVVHALGSPHIPAQEAFVVPYGVKSALGFGTALPSGEIAAFLIFSRAEIPRRTAELFRTMALSARYALLPYDAGPLFDGEPSRRGLDERMMIEREACLTDLLSVFQRSAVSVNQSLKQITDHVTFGILLLNSEHRAEGSFTRSCHELLGTAHLTGRLLSDILGIKDERARGMLALGLEQFFDDFLPEEMLLTQFQSRFRVGSRMLRVEPRAIRSTSGAVAQLLLTISDDTLLEESYRQAQQLETLISILQQRGAFCDFLADFRERIVELRESVSSAEEVRARRILHTLKGNAASFGLSEVSEVVHAIEDLPRLATEVIEPIETAMRTFLDNHADVLGISYLEEPAFTVQQSALVELAKVAESLTGEAKNSVQSWVRRTLWRPFRQLLGPIDKQVEALAARLNREVSLTLRGGDTLVDPNTLGPVVRNLTHLLRNAVDHGIEAAEERGEKPRRGAIHVTLTESEGAWQLLVSDDGRGIDGEKLAQRAVALGILPEETAARLDASQRLELVFHDDLSTAAQATDISGRGVGMGALRSAVLRAGGRISISTQRGVGTEFLIVVPRREDGRALD